MARLIDESLLNEEFDPFEEQRRVKKVKQTIKKKKRNRRLGKLFLVCLVVFVVSFIYFMTDGSKVKSIRVEHSGYLSHDFILEKSNIDYDSRYWLVISPVVEFMMERDVCIKNVDVKHTENHCIVITVEEEHAVGYFWDKEQLKLLMANGKAVKISSNYYSVLKSLPFIRDDVSDRKVLAKELSKLDYKILSNIAEVGSFTSTYDDSMLRLIMADGHQVFTDVEAIGLLQNYNYITENLTKKSCLVLDLPQNVAYTQSCAELNAEEKLALEKKMSKNESDLQDNLDNNGEENSDE